MLVTVLCCMLPNAGAPGAEVGLNDMQRLMQLVSHLTVREVRRYESMIQQVTGDGFLALFAVPGAREDHAQGPVTGDLRLQQLLRECLQRLYRLSGEALGLHSGLVEV